MSVGRNLFYAAFLAGISANIAQIAVLRLVLGQFYGTELHLGTFLAVWLFGVAAGSRLGSSLHVSAEAVVTASAIAPVLSVLSFIFGTTFFLPTAAGELLPFLPVCGVLVVTILPVALPVGALLPAFLSGTGGNSRLPIGKLFAIESAGGAVGGILFAGFAGGAAEPVALMFSCVVVSAAALCLATSRRMRIAAGIAAVLLPLAVPALPRLQERMDGWLWNRFHPGYDLARSFDTAYQSVKIARYKDQYSLFLDNNFTMTWPDRPSAELRIHSFLSSLPETFPSSSSAMLIVGVPSPDLLAECMKYKQINIIIVDLDSALTGYMKTLTAPDPRIVWKNEDPRAYLRAHPGAFDAVLILPSDPTTLVGNRMFTREAIRDAVAALTETGAVDYAVSGAENYLGGDLEQAILSLHRDVESASAEVFAVPGDPIHFRASRAKGVLATAPVILAGRFDRRGIPTESFRSALFADLLMPFRLEELRRWLARDVAASENTDAMPAALSRQLHLWDIYSGSGVGPTLRALERIDLSRALLVLLAAFCALALLSFRGGVELGSRHLAFCAVALTGFFGLAAEMILLLMYQIRHGAMFGMASMFFGLYMLGLALGSLLSRRVSPSWRAIGAVKVAQTMLAFAGILVLHRPDLHSLPVLGGMTFLIALTAGCEFPLLAELAGGTADSVAGLIAADNLPAMLAALSVGVWMLPALGMDGSWIILATGAAVVLVLLRTGNPARV